MSKPSHFLRRLFTDPHDCVLRNAATGEVVAPHLEAAFDPASRRTGLLGRARLEPERALVLAPCSAVHTVAMRFPIDVLFVDRDGLVRKVVTHLRPWRIAVSFGAFAVIECAAGVIARRGIQAGDRLSLSGARD